MRRDRYLKKHNTHKIHDIHAPVGFELAIRASERPQTHTSDRAVTGIGRFMLIGSGYSAALY
jgi:hypothetical protein